MLLYDCLIYLANPCGSICIGFVLVCFYFGGVVKSYWVLFVNFWDRKSLCHSVFSQVEKRMAFISSYCLDLS